MRRFFIFPLLLMVLGVQLIVPLTFAQATGTIIGVCKDIDGTPLAQAEVDWTSTNTGHTYALKTNKRGQYFSLGISPGKYNVVLLKDGKELFHINGVTVATGEVTQDIDLKKEQGSAAPGGAVSSYDEALKNANTLFKNNQLPEALQAATALIQKDPNRWEGYGLIGAIDEAQNKLPQAQASYQQALALAPDNIKPQITQAIQQIEGQPTEKQKRDDVSQNTSAPVDSSGPSVEQSLDFIKRKLAAPQQCLNGGTISYAMMFSGCKVEIVESFDLISLTLDKLQLMMNGLAVQGAYAGTTVTSRALNLGDLDSNSVTVEKPEGMACNSQTQSLTLHAIDSGAKIVTEQQKKSRQTDGTYSSDGAAERRNESQATVFVLDKVLAQRLQKAFVHAVELCSANRPKDVF